NWYHSSQGTLQPFSNRDIQVPVQNVRIPVFAGQPQSIYIRFADEGFTELPIQVSSLNTFKSVIADNIFFKGLQFGAIGVATFITLLIWLVTGRLTLLWLGLLFLSSGVFAMFLSGYTFQYIFPNNPRLNQQIGIVSDILSNGFLLMFIGGL